MAHSNSMLLTFLKLVYSKATNIIDINNKNLKQCYLNQIQLDNIQACSHFHSIKQIHKKKATQNYPSE